MTAETILHPAYIQGSPEWVASRNRYIGGSEASIIMCHNPYKTPYELWQQKTGISAPDKENFAMARGSRLEPFAIQYVEKMEGIKIKDHPVLLHPKYDFIRVSLDGVTECGQYIVEAKSPMSEHSSSHVQTVIGQACPLIYYSQVQLCLEVARYYYPNLKGAYYVSYIDQSPDQSVICETLYDEKFVARLIKQCEKFWECVKTNTPPRMQEDEYENIELAENNFQWQDLTSKYLKVCEMEKQILQEKNQLRQELISMSDNRNIKGYGVTVYHSEKKGSVDYKKIPELKQVDLEKYRKEPTIVSTIKTS